MKKFYLFLSTIYLMGTIQAHTVSHHGITIEYEDLSGYIKKLLFYDSSMKVGLPIDLLNRYGIKLFKVTIKNQSAKPISLDFHSTDDFSSVQRDHLVDLFENSIFGKKKFMALFFAIFFCCTAPPISLGCLLGWWYMHDVFKTKYRGPFEKRLDKWLLANQEIAPSKEFSGYYFVNVDKEQNKNCFKLLFKKGEDALFFNCPFDEPIKEADSL